VLAIGLMDKQAGKVSLTGVRLHVLTVLNFLKCGVEAQRSFSMGGVGDEIHSGYQSYLRKFGRSSSSTHHRVSFILQCRITGRTSRGALSGDPTSIALRRIL
jgi:hypothetical protein